MISTSLACHLDERGNETFDPLGRRLGFLAPLLAQGFGFRDGFLQRSDMDFKGLDPLGRRLGFLAPLLAQGFGFRDGFLQRSDMGVQSAAFVRFRPLARRMGILLSY
jgi:hypothetical protein